MAVANILRIAKIVAIRGERTDNPEKPHQYYAYMDGGHKLPINEDMASYLAGVIDQANTSDQSFFSRGG